jgi:hydroxylaminobenzene mutase
MLRRLGRAKDRDEGLSANRRAGRGLSRWRPLSRKARTEPAATFERKTLGKRHDSMQDKGRRLLWHGILLFLLGLLTGLFMQHLKNPRMGLAAHLEGLMNGTFLLALGAAWSQVRLSPRLSSAAYWTALCGTYGNWAVTTAAAVLGTAAMTPIAAAGHSGQPWQEAVVTVGFVGIGLAVLVAAILLLVGFRGRHGQSEPAQTG